MATKKIEMQDELGNVYHPHTTAGVVFMANGQTAETAVNGKAPSSHASSNGDTYGKGTGANFGHVKLSDSIISSSSTDSGVAATPSAVNKAATTAGAYTYTIGDGTVAASRRPPAYAYANMGSKSLDVVIGEIQNGFNNYGGTIFLQKGTYYINAPITLKPRVRLLGCGKGTVIIRNFYDFPEGEYESKMMILADECAVENLRLAYGENTQQPGDDSYLFPYFATPDYETPVTGVTIKGIERETVFSAGNNNDVEYLVSGALKDSLISECRFKNIYEGVQLSSSSNVTIENCDFSYAEYGVFVTESSNIVIKNNCITHSEHPIAISYTESCLISGNDVSNSTNTASVFFPGGICIDVFSKYVNVEGNICRDCGFAGIDAHQASYITISGNLCTGTDYGINAPVMGTITGNICMNNKYADINLNDGRSCTVTGNTCITSSDYEVYNSHRCIHVSAKDSVVSGNIIRFKNGSSSDYLSGQGSIVLDATAKNCVVTGNYIMGKDVTDANTDTANKNLKANNKYSGTQG